MQNTLSSLLNPIIYLIMFICILAVPLSCLTYSSMALIRRTPVIKALHTLNLCLRGFKKACLRKMRFKSLNRSLSYLRQCLRRMRCEEQCRQKLKISECLRKMKWDKRSFRIVERYLDRRSRALNVVYNTVRFVFAVKKCKSLAS